jgi:hypothetical protein
VKQISETKVKYCQSENTVHQSTTSDAKSPEFQFDIDGSLAARRRYPSPSLGRERRSPIAKQVNDEIGKERGISNIERREVVDCAASAIEKIGN